MAINAYYMRLQVRAARPRSMTLERCFASLNKNTYVTFCERMIDGLTPLRLQEEIRYSQQHFYRDYFTLYIAIRAMTRHSISNGPASFRETAGDSVD